MFLYTVRYCRNDLAIKRLKHIMKDNDDTIVDRYIETDGQYILFFNVRYGTTLLLFKKNDDSRWLAVFKTNYTKRQYIYCILAARAICKNVHILVNDVDDRSLAAEAKLLNEAGYKFKLVDSLSERCDAFSKSDDIENLIPTDFRAFAIKPDSRVPVSINRKN